MYITRHLTEAIQTGQRKTHAFSSKGSSPRVQHHFSTSYDIRISDSGMQFTKNIRTIVFAVIAVFLTVASFTGCKTTKDIDENYLVVSSMAVIPNEEDHGMLTLKIEGDYAESAWGIERIEQEPNGNTIVLSGTLVSEGQGAFEYDVVIPPNVDVVKFNKRVLWTRNQKTN